MSEQRTERKVVTVLFADLVGFTQRSEQLDPEDVAAVLRPYRERLRSELERFGGTVEKFIGDAVMALFGAPVAHEDDPERAIRAALAIRDWAREEGDVQVRIAVNTGEALVDLGARPESGEGMAAGDVVNTAARLQSAAPVNGILVGETTYRATRNVIDYADAPAVDAKGKSEPLDVWEAQQVRARVETESVSTEVPLVGRERELDQLADALTRARTERTPQLVTIVGVPGIGKSRLVAELFAIVEADPDIISWRRGRSLPYGEGVTFWALAAIVKAQAGILESDTSEDAAAKLSATIADLVEDDADREWLDSKLRPLLGMTAESEVGGDRRGESFAAWRRFFEALAERRPLVLVFEDLHWADDDLLDFVDELADWVEGVPLLIVCTARPELLDRRPGWGGGKRNSVTVSLAPLGERDTAKLISRLLERSVLPAETQTALLARAGGNPLYAEQFVRMFLERGTESELPETVQGIIAARLDALSREEKALVQDAAVLGKVFWAGALQSIDGRSSAEVETSMRALARKEFVRRAHRSSVAGETEYEFGHLLVRDVAYGQIPRVERAAKHRAVASWIESLSPDRSDDRAEMLAYHYVQALELSTAAGVELAGLSEAARNALRYAGDRAMTLGSYGAAVRAYTAALALISEDDSDWPVLVVRCEQARDLGGETPREAEVALARDRLAAVGDVEDAAAAEFVLARAAWWTGRGEEAEIHCDRALEILGDVDASPTKLHVLEERARQLMVGGQLDGAIAVGTQALEMAERLGLDHSRAGLLVTVGTARFNTGRAGEDELRSGLELAIALNDAHVIQRGHNNLAEVAWMMLRADELLPLYATARRYAERFANVRGLLWNDSAEATAQLCLGGWDAAERLIDSYFERLRDGHDYNEGTVLYARAHIAFGRNDPKRGVEASEQAERSAREARDPQTVGPPLSQYATFLALDGRINEAADRVREVAGIGWMYFSWAVDLALASALVGLEEEYLRIVPNAAPTGWVRAGEMVARGEFARAAQLLDVFPAVAAHVRLVGGHILSQRGSSVEAQRLLLDAVRFYETIGASGFIRRAESLLALIA